MSIFLQTADKVKAVYLYQTKLKLDISCASAMVLSKVLELVILVYYFNYWPEKTLTEFCFIRFLLFYEKFKYQDFDFLRGKKNKKTSYNVKIK